VARSPLVFADDVWELLAQEADGEGTQQMHRRHLEGCLGKLKAGQRQLLLHVHSSGVVMREAALQSGKSEQAFYKVIQRLRAVVLSCVTKALAAENA
jgi:RNA polymerase sigma-70 factor (ECF subfamily)